MNIFKHKHPTITLPIDVFDFRAGDVVEVGQFFKALDQSLDKNEAELDDLKRDNEKLKQEIDYYQYEISNFYKPRSPYEVNGVRERDFY